MAITPVKSRVTTTPTTTPPPPPTPTWTAPIAAKPPTRQEAIAAYNERKAASGDTSPATTTNPDLLARAESLRKSNTPPEPPASGIASNGYVTNTETPLTVGANALMTQAQKPIANQISGQAYVPTAVGIQEGQARAEAQRRAAAATAINQAGLSGSPLGAGAGYGVEVDLMRNRFDNAINLEQARQADMRAGSEAAMQYGDAVNRIEQGQLQNYNEQRDLTTKDVLANYALWDGYDKAVASGIEGADEKYIEDYLAQNPDLANRLAKINGGQMPTAAQAKAIMNNMRSEANVGDQMRRGLSELGYTNEMIDAVMSSSAEDMMEQIGWKKTTDAQGNVTWEPDTDKKAADGAAPYIREEEPFKNFSGSADDLKAIAQKTPEVNSTSNNPVISKDGTIGAKANLTFDGQTQNGLGNAGVSQYKPFEEAIDKETPVKVDGVLYYVEKVSSSTPITHWGGWDESGNTVYRLTDPATGKTRTVTTARRYFDD